jgi:hypothetical protein
MLAGQVTKAATEKDEKFPSVTVDLFEVIGRQAREMSGILEITWSPYVYADQFDAYASYSAENIGWLNESAALYVDDNPALNLTLDDFDLSDTDYSLMSIMTGGPPVSADPWAARWQSSPPPNSSYVINIDLNDYGANRSNAAIEKFRMSVMTAVVDPRPGYEASFRPLCAVAHPVFENFFDEDSEVVGKVFSLFLWELNMVNLLPEGVSGIVAVLKNSCNQSYTYALDGTLVSNRLTRNPIEITTLIVVFIVLLVFTGHIFGHGRHARSTIR